MMQNTVATPPTDVHVIPAGGRFKIRYTHSGKHYEDSLGKALDDLDGMHFFGSEVKLQQTDIRLVALDRRTYSTLGEIHNLHFAQASEVERFILGFSVGQAGSSASGPTAHPGADRPSQVVGFKVARSKVGQFLSLVLVLSDGREDAQHLLTSSTIRTLRERGVFDEAFDIRMSLTNDTLMAYRKDMPGQKPVETVPVGYQGSTSDAEGDAAIERVGDFLNHYCRKSARPAP
jgi:hypothetical protein